MAQWIRLCLPYVAQGSSPMPTIYILLNMGKIRPLFVYFCSFHMANIAQIDYNDSVLWTRTQGGSIVGADESTELWRHPTTFFHL